MSDRYHLNPRTMNPNKCRAKDGACPFGADAPHFESRNDALYAAEVKLTQEYGSTHAKNRQAHRARIALQDAGAVKTAVQAGEPSVAKQTLKQRLFRAAGDMSNVFDAWAKKNPGLAKAADRAIVAAVLTSVVAGPVVGGMIGNHMAEQDAAHHDVVAVSTQQGTLSNYRGNGKFPDTIEATINGKIVTIPGNDAYKMKTDSGNIVVSQDAEGDTVSVTRVNVIDRQNDETYVIDNMVIPNATKDLVQEAVRARVGADSLMAGVALGLVAGVAPGAAAVGISNMADTANGKRRPVLAKPRGSMNLTKFLITGVPTFHR